MDVILIGVQEVIVPSAQSVKGIIVASSNSVMTLRVVGAVGYNRVGGGAERDPSLGRGYSKARLHLTTGLSQSKEKQNKNRKII